MADVLAIISKAQFEEQARDAKVGERLRIEKYASAHKSLETLSEGGSLFLVTVRPPNEQLWLVAVLESPKFRKTEWRAAPSEAPIANIDALKKKLRFATGKGIEAKPGALGMSLQSPRRLTEEDVALLRAAIGGEPKPAPAKGKGKAKGRLEEKEKEKADGSLLESWRQRPAVSLADALDAELAAAPALEPPKDQAEWLKRAKSITNPAEMRALLGSLRAKKLDETWERVRTVGKLNPDPRVARALTDFVREVPFTSDTSKPTWVQILGVLAETGDPRVLEWLPAVRENLGVRALFLPWIRNRLLEVEKKLKARFPLGAPPADAATSARIAAAPKPKAKPAGTRDKLSLLEEIYANPDDDGPRLVLADFLQEKGDPRGEFIALQCQRPDPKREKALLKEHGRKWLGELEPFVGADFGFRRGFLSRAMIKQKNEREAKAAENLAGWATVEVLVMAGVSGGASSNARFSQSIPRTLRSVREIRDLADDGIDSLVARTPYLRPRKIVFGSCDRVEPWLRLQRAGMASALTELEGLPSEWLRDSPLLDQLTSISDRGSLTEEYLDWVIAHPQLVIHLSETDYSTKIEMKDGLVAVTFTIEALGLRDARFDYLGAKETEKRAYARGERLVSDLTKAIGTTKIQSLTVLRATNDRDLHEGARATTEKSLKAKLPAHLDTLRALRTFDLEAIQVGKGTRTPALATPTGKYERVIAMENYPDFVWCENDMIHVLQARDVLVVDPSTGKVIREIPVDHRSAASVTPDGKILLDSVYRHVYRFDLSGDLDSREYLHDYETLEYVHLSADGGRVLGLTGDGYSAHGLVVLPLGDTKPDAPTTAKSLHTRKSVVDARMMRDGKRCIVADVDGRITVDEIGGESTLLVTSAVSKGRSLALSPSERILAWESEGGTVVVLDLTSRKERQRLKVEGRQACACDDGNLVVGGKDGIVLLDLETGSSRSIFTGAARTVALSPDGKWVATRTAGALVVVDLGGRERLRASFPDS